jgi:hypothetical protein
MGRHATDADALASNGSMHAPSPCQAVLDGDAVLAIDVAIEETTAAIDRAEATAAQKSIRIEMIQTRRKNPWTPAAALSFTVGWWKESVAVIRQVGTGLSGSHACFRK